MDTKLAKMGQIDGQNELASPAEAPAPPQHIPLMLGS